MSDIRDTLPTGGGAAPVGTSPTTYPPTTPNGAGTPAAGGVDTTRGGLDTAKHEAAHVAETAKDEAAHVGETAKEEAKHVGREARTQLANLYDQTRSELAVQAAVRQSRLADGIRSASSELRGMAESSGNGSIATDVVRQASERLDGAASWLSMRDPGAVVEEVKRYARRRPGMFLAFAALAGVAVGRLTRSLAAGAPSNGSASRGVSGGTASGFASPPPSYGYGVDTPPTGSTTPLNGSHTAQPLRSTVRDDEWSEDPLRRSEEQG